MNFIIFDISKLLNALTLSKRLKGWRTKINSYTVNSCKVGCVFPMVVVPILPHADFGPNDHRENTPHFSTVVYIYVYWLIFGHLSNDYELSAIKIRAEIYFRVKNSFFGRKFIFDLAEKYTTEISSEIKIVFRKVTNLISKCPDDSIYILFFRSLAFLISQTKDENLPSDNLWLARFPSIVDGPRPTWPDFLLISRKWPRPRLFGLIMYYLSSVINHAKIKWG